VSFNRYLAQKFGGPNPEYGEYALKVVKIKRVFFHYFSLHQKDFQVLTSLWVTFMIEICV
jgi:hypothetical protein